MKKKIALLGSTGSIGKTLIKIILKDKKNFNVILLSTNKNYKLLLKQAKILKVKNLIIKDKKTFDNLLKRKVNNKIRIFNNFNQLDFIFKSKIDYTLNAISGIEGLYPTLKIISYTKSLAIANKEALICGWSLIEKELKKNKTIFLPVDSEHFSIWYDKNFNNTLNIEKIFLTASGGPFLNHHVNILNQVKISDALKHPNWKMGKKISIDSATMMNKVFEVIEAKNIFNLSYKKLGIIIHPNSYVHALIKYNDGMIKLICHETTMKIPIYNTLYYNNLKRKLLTKKINLQKLNNLNFTELNQNQYPITKILNFLPRNHSLYETVIVSINDYLVDLFLNKIINFKDISTLFLKLVKLPQFSRYKNIKPKNVEQILKLNEFVRLKIKSLSI